MWRCTPARWTGKSLQFERWQVAVQLTPCRDRLTGPALDMRIGCPGPLARQPGPPVGASDVVPNQPSAKHQVDLDVCKSDWLASACQSRAGITIKLFV